MTVRSFFDTSVLVYTDDNDAPDKQKRALDLYAECRREKRAVASTQVLQEYFVTVTRKLGVDVAVARRKTELFGGMEIVPVRTEDILAAADLQRLHGFSFWDALILRAALVSGCARLLSEDFEHGRRIESLEIVNPFV